MHKVMLLLSTAYNLTFLLTTVFALHLRPLFFTVQRFKNCKTHSKKKKKSANKIQLSEENTGA